VRARALAAFAGLLLLAGCVSLDGNGDGDGDGDKDRPKAEERAKKYCEDAAQARGWRVEKVGSIEKLSKRQYEVKLRVAAKTKQLPKADQESDRVICRYDDENRQAVID
jgi:hypothetical protein